MNCYRERNNQHRLDMHPFVTRTNVKDTHFAIRTLVYHMESSLTKYFKYESLRLLTLLINQHLTPNFCVTYILDEEWATCDHDTYITAKQVLRLQPHITKEELAYEWRNRKY
jgi:hypothetical protein